MLLLDYWKNRLINTKALKKQHCFWSLAFCNFFLQLIFLKPYLLISFQIFFSSPCCSAHLSVLLPLLSFFESSPSHVLLCSPYAVACYPSPLFLSLALSLCLSCVRWWLQGSKAFFVAQLKWRHQFCIYIRELQLRWLFSSHVLHTCLQYVLSLLFHNVFPSHLFALFPSFPQLFDILLKLIWCFSYFFFHLKIFFSVFLSYKLNIFSICLHI